MLYSNSICVGSSFKCVCVCACAHIQFPTYPEYLAILNIMRTSYALSCRCATQSAVKRLWLSLITLWQSHWQWLSTFFTSYNPEWLPTIWHFTTLKKYHWNVTDNIKENMTKQLMVIPKGDFPDSFKKWKRWWNKYVRSQAKYFERV